MKKLILGIFFLILSLVRISAADALALIVYEEPVNGQDDMMKVWITAASGSNIEYKTTPQSLNRNRIRRDKAEGLPFVKSVYFFEPPVFKEAVQLFESRDYRGAREKFAECKEAYDKLDNLKGNYGTLAGFYELETCRKMFDLESLKKLLDGYQFGSLVRGHQRDQLEVYAVWDAVRTKSWARLDSLAKDNPKAMQGYRIQIYFGSLSEARAVKAAFRKEHPDVGCQLLPISPNYAVTVGNFRDQWEARRALDSGDLGTWRNALVIPSEIHFALN